MRYFHRFMMKVFRSVAAVYDSAPLSELNGILAVIDRAYRTQLALLTLVSLLGVTVYAEAPSWVQWLPSNSPALAVLYRMVPSLGGQVAVRRPRRQASARATIADQHKDSGRKS